MEKELTSRQKQAMKTRRRIFECAIELFSEKNYKDVKITDICEAANVPVGGFYYYFDNKEQIIEEAYNSSYQTQAEEAEKYEGINPLDKIRKIVRANFQNHNRRGYIFTTMFLKNEVVNGKKYMDEKKSITKFIDTACEEAVEKEILFGNPTLISASIYRIMRGTCYDWAIKKGEFDLFEEGEGLVEAVLEHYSHES